MERSHGGDGWTGVRSTASISVLRPHLQGSTSLLMCFCVSTLLIKGWGRSARFQWTIINQNNCFVRFKESLSILILLIFFQAVFVLESEWKKLKANDGKSNFQMRMHNTLFMCFHLVPVRRLAALKRCQTHQCKVLVNRETAGKRCNLNF